MQLFHPPSVRVLLLLLPLLASVHVALGAPSDQPTQIVAHNGSWAVRSHFKLPKLFDFDQFKVLFHKRYGSLVEELVRRKLFLGRAFQAFVSAVSYKHWRSSFYLGLNEMSDWSREDLERDRLGRGALSDSPPEASGARESRPEVGADDAPMVDEEEVREELGEIEAHRSEPGFRELAEELDAVKGAVEYRSLLAGADYRSEDESDEEESQVEDEPEAGNESLKGAKHRRGGGGGGGFLQSLANGVKSLFVHNNNNNRRHKFNAEDENNADDPDADGYQDYDDEDLQREAREFVVRDIEGPDAVFVDHRESGCFTAPRSQRNCGSCYAFSTVGLFEWMYCNQTKQRAAFTEQYMVDCGGSVGLGGCSGGKLGLAHEFVEQYGLEMRQLYPYRSEVNTCPYEDVSQLKQLGRMRLTRVRKTRVNWRKLDKHLPAGPIVVGLQLGPSFRQYAGGVHTNSDCRPDDPHAMLLVGSGRENNQKYWLFRNSYSVTWGEGGYYRMDQTALARCLLDREFIQINATIETNEYSKFRQLALKTQYRKYLNHTSRRAPERHPLPPPTEATPPAEEETSSPEPIDRE